jgi:hypothetical protein
MVWIIMESLMATQTILCQGQINLARSLLLGKVYMKALTLFAQDPGGPEELLRPEGKGTESVLHGAVTLECILPLSYMGQQATVVKIKVLPGQVTNRVTELSSTVVAVGVAGSADGTGKAPFKTGRVNDIAAVAGTHMVSARAMAHLTTYTFLDIGVFVWVIACQVATSAVILPRLLPPEGPCPGRFAKGPDPPCYPQIAPSVDDIPLCPVNTDDDLYLLRLETLATGKNSCYSTRILPGVLQRPGVGCLLPFPENTLVAPFAGPGTRIIPFKFSGNIEIPLIDFLSLMAREA